MSRDNYTWLREGPMYEAVKAAIEFLGKSPDEVLTVLNSGDDLFVLFKDGHYAVLAKPGSEMEKDMADAGAAIEELKVPRGAKPH